MSIDIKGLELAERFYLEHGAPMIKEKFPHLEGIIAAGLVGSGSECFGYDDGISRDHDFYGGCLWFECRLLDYNFPAFWRGSSTRDENGR